MKKILYGTTALIAAGMISTAASAAEGIKLELGGYMDWYVAAAKQESSFTREMGNAATHYNQFDVIGDGEVYFQGETTLDNGMKVAVNVQLEAGTGGSTRSADESFVTVETGYGQVVLGATRNAASKMHVSAPEVGRIGTSGLEENKVYDLVVAPGAVSRLDATWLNTDGKVNKVSYITPTLYGLTMGATWTPGADAANGADNADRSLVQGAGFKEGYALNLKYDETFGDLRLVTTAAYGAYNVGGKHAQGEYSLGANLGYAGFTFGGAYRKVSDHTDITGWNGAARAVGTNSLNGYAWNVGAAYEAHKYGVSLNYMKSEVEGLRPQSAADVARRGKDEVETYQLSGNYKLGAGVESFATVAHVKYADEATKTAATADDHNKGWAFATGIALSF